MESTTATSTAPEFWVCWDMGDYGPFSTEPEAKAFQRTHKMTGSSIERV